MLAVKEINKKKFKMMKLGKSIPMLNILWHLPKLIKEYSNFSPKSKTIFSNLNRNSKTQTNQIFLAESFLKTQTEIASQVKNLPAAANEFDWVKIKIIMIKSKPNTKILSQRKSSKNIFHFIWFIFPLYCSNDHKNVHKK